jgi:hypothetical protein
MMTLGEMMKKENRPYSTGRFYAQVMTFIGRLLMVAAGFLALFTFIHSISPNRPVNGMSLNDYYMFVSFLSYPTAVFLFVTGFLTVVGAQYLLAVFDNTYHNREILETLKEYNKTSAGNS